MGEFASDDADDVDVWWCCLVTMSEDVNNDVNNDNDNDVDV